MTQHRPRLPLRRQRREPVGPWGHYVNDVLVRNGLSYKKAYDAVNRAAHDDGERSVNYGRHTINNWIGGVIPHADALRWIARAWNEPIEAVSSHAEAHRTWRYEQRARAVVSEWRPHVPAARGMVTPSVSAIMDPDEGAQRHHFLTTVLGPTAGVDLVAAPSTPPTSTLTHELTDLAAWVERTDVGDSALDLLAETTHHLADNHTRMPPRRMLADVLRVQRQVELLLRQGKQRLGQIRELFRIQADLLAQACILIGDLHNDDVAIAYGATAALCAREAGVNQAPALSAQAKTERWRHRYAASADLARRGFECSPPTPVRVLLASQEASAAALLGDHERAQQALRRAEEAADSQLAADSGVSPWSCPRPRLALYSLFSDIRRDSPQTALQAAEMADAGWASGEPWALGTWAQVRFGAAIAHVMRGELDAAADQLAPVMSMPPEFRLATVTNYLVEMDERLRHRRFDGSPLAANLCEQIREFNAGALPAPARETT